MLETIEAKLREIEGASDVFYGTAGKATNTALWNYIVFSRDHTSRSTNSTSFTDYYTVAIVHENWIPDEMILSCIEKMESIHGVRLANGDITFEYSEKPSTRAVIELAIMSFACPRKRVK